MITTPRGLAIVAGLALVLALVLVVDPRRTRTVADRALTPGLDLERVGALRWDRPGQRSIQLVREAGGWRWAQPVPAHADPAAVATVLATLRAARWHRRAAAPAAGATITSLTIGDRDGGVLRTLHLGQPIEGAEQQWIVEGDRAVLVDRWVARALAPDPLALLIRRPFEVEARAGGIAIVGPADDPFEVRLEGHPRRLVRPHGVVVDAAISAELEAVLAALTIIALPPADAVAGAALLTLDLDTVRGSLGEGCDHPALVLLVASTGTGCVPRADVEAVRAQVERLRHGPVEAIAEPRPAPLSPATITLGDGAVLDLTKDPRIDGAPADPARVAELLAVLATPVPRAALRPTGTAAAVAAIRVTEASGAALTLELLAPPLVRRAGEPVALRLPPAAWAVLTRAGAALREVAWWVEDPLTISALAIDDVTYERGAVIGEWTRSAASGSSPRLDPAALEALVAQLAAPPRTGATTPAFAPVHRVQLTVTPPMGAPVQHELEIGAPTRQGCPARARATTAVLPIEVCTAIARHAR